MKTILDMSGGLRRDSYNRRLLLAAGAQRAQHDLRRVPAVIGAEVLDVALAVASVHERLDQNLADHTLQHQLRQVLGRSAEHANPQTVRLAG